MSAETLAAALLKDVPTALIRRAGSDEHTITVIALDDAVAALSRAMSDDLAERAGEVLAHLNSSDPFDYPMSASSAMQAAADLITDLLTQNAALRAERDYAQSLTRNWQSESGAEKARAERLEAALRETAQVLRQCTFQYIRVEGQYFDREEVVSRADAALKGADHE